jgi:hypothetical protein
VNGLTANIEGGDASWSNNDNIFLSVMADVLEQNRLAGTGFAGDKHMAKGVFKTIEKFLLFSTQSNLGDI